MYSSVFNRVDVLEDLFDEPGQLGVHLSNCCVILFEERLRICIIIFSAASLTAFLWLFGDVIAVVLFLEILSKVGNGSADCWTQISALPLVHPFLYFCSFLCKFDFLFLFVNHLVSQSLLLSVTIFLHILSQSVMQIKCISTLMERKVTYVFSKLICLFES